MIPSGPVLTVLQVIGIVGIGVLVIRDPAIRAFVGTVAIAFGLVAVVFTAVVLSAEGLGQITRDFSWVPAVVGPTLVLIGWVLVRWARHSPDPDVESTPPG